MEERAVLEKHQPVPAEFIPDGELGQAKRCEASSGGRPPEIHRPGQRGAAAAHCAGGQRPFKLRNVAGWTGSAHFQLEVRTSPESGSEDCLFRKDPVEAPPTRHYEPPVKRAMDEDDR